MASEELRAVFTAVETISNTLNDIGRSIDSVSSKLNSLDAAMSGNTAISQAHETQMQTLGSEIDDLEDQLAGANRELQELTGTQLVNAASAATQSGAMEIAAQVIDEAGDEAMTSAAQMGVLDTVMKELSLSGSALSVNIGAFNISLRNLTPLLPIAASMGSLVTVIGALITALGEATIALGAFGAAGAVAFAQDLEDELAGVNNQAEALQAIMKGIRDIFIEAFEPIIDAETSEFFVNLVEGAAEMANRFAQALDQMRDVFLPFFGRVGDLVNREFDDIATAIQNTFIEMEPVIIRFLEWFLEGLPEALRFMSDVTNSLAEPIGDLTNSLLDALQAVIDIAVNVFQGLAPAFSLAINIVTDLVRVIETLSNGFLQAAILIGTLSFATFKFLGMANAIANIGLTAANAIVQMGTSAQTMGTAIATSASNSFAHLSALGKVMTGQMSIAEASGQVHKDLADDIEEAAREVKNLEDKLEDVTAKYTALVATVEGSNLGDAIGDQARIAQTQLDDFSRAMTSSSDEVADAVQRMDSELTGVVFDPRMRGSPFRDPETGETISRAAARSKTEFAEVGLAASNLANASDDSAKGMNKLRNSFKNSTKSIRNVGTALSALLTRKIGLSTFMTAAAGLSSVLTALVASIGAVIGASAIAVGIIGNMDTITTTAKSAFDGLTNVITEVGSILMNVGVPAWNLMVDVLEFILTPLVAVFRGLEMIGQALGIVSEEGTSTGSVIGLLIDIFGGVMDVAAILFELLQSEFGFMSDLLFEAIIIPFRLMAFWIEIRTGLFETLFNFIVSFIPQSVIDRFNESIRTLVDILTSLPSVARGIFSELGKLIRGIITSSIEFLQPFINLLNEVISASNKFLNTDFEQITLDADSGPVSDLLSGVRTTTQEVRENIRSDADEPDRRDVATQPDVNLSLEDTIEQNVDVTADPEEKEGLRRIIKDAMNEANSAARRTQGMGR